MTVAVEERREQAPPADRSGRVALGLVGAAWAVILGLLLRHREIISSDTLSNYVHVWYVSDHVWHGHGLPFRMPVLAHGDALAFPYGFIPWIVAVLGWPLLHEWSVTLCLGLGFILMIAATFWAFPEVRRPWWAAAVLLNPAFAMAVLLGQLPFMWAIAMMLGAIACWRTGRRTWATVLATLAQLTHAPIVVPLMAFTVLGRARFEQPSDRRVLLSRWLLSVVLSLPAIALVFNSPVTEETSFLLSLWIEFETLFLRALVIWVPIAMIIVLRRLDTEDQRRRAGKLVAAAMLTSVILASLGAGMRVGWGALFRDPTAAASSLPASAHFTPGRVYRVLSQGDGKYEAYAVVRAGGLLDSEFFPESLHWRSFRDITQYRRFLHNRAIDYVAVFYEYSSRRTNEKALLDEMVAEPECRNGTRAELVEHAARYELYAIHYCS